MSVTLAFHDEFYDILTARDRTQASLKARQVPYYPNSLRHFLVEGGCYKFLGISISLSTYIYYYLDIF